MNIYLIRHGRQNSTLCNVNVPLSEVGIEQARVLGNRMAGYNIEGLYSSDLIRARETAKILNEEISRLKGQPLLEHHILPELREIDFGQLEGKSDEEVEHQFGEFMKQRASMLEDIAFPGGECGEDVVKRAMPALRSIALSGRNNIAVVTHGGTIRSLVTHILGMNQSSKLLFAKSLENCSITHLIYDKEVGKFYLQRFNDYAHLEVKEELMRHTWK